MKGLGVPIALESIAANLEFIKGLLSLPAISISFSITSSGLSFSIFKRDERLIEMAQTQVDSIREILLAQRGGDIHELGSDFDPFGVFDVSD